MLSLTGDIHKTLIMQQLITIVDNECLTVISKSKEFHIILICIITIKISYKLYRIICDCLKS